MSCSGLQVVHTFHNLTQRLAKKKKKKKDQPAKLDALCKQAGKVEHCIWYKPVEKCVSV